MSFWLLSVGVLLVAIAVAIFAFFAHQKALELRREREARERPQTTAQIMETERRMKAAKVARRAADDDRFPGTVTGGGYEVKEE